MADTGRRVEPGRITGADVHPPPAPENFSSSQCFPLLSQELRT